jgi:mono/diheme cytochrome c family protein
MKFRLAAIACSLFVATPAFAQTAPDPSTMKVSASLTGAQIYAMTCGACHQANGNGLPNQFPPLASEFVTGSEDRLIHIVLRGLTGEVEVEGEMFKGEMPGWAPALNDAQVASVLTYIRKSFGNNAPAVTAERVAAVRMSSAARSKPYTAAELASIAK